MSERSNLIPLINYNILFSLLKLTEKDLIPMAATFIIAVVFGISYGIIAGFILNIFFVLHRNARPNITCESFAVGPEKVLVMSPFQNLYFPAADAVLKKITTCAFSTGSDTTIIVINGHLVRRIDASVAETFANFYSMTKKYKKKLVFWNWEARPREVIIHTEPRFEFLFRDSENLETLLQQMDITVPLDLTTRPFYYR